LPGRHKRSSSRQAGKLKAIGLRPPARAGVAAGVLLDLIRSPIAG